MSHLNKPSKELILDLINEAGQEFILTLRDIEFGIPGPNSTGNLNTQLVVSGLTNDGIGYRGQRTVRYNRLDLNVAMPPTDAQTLEVAVPNDGFETKLEVVARLNKTYQLQIGPDDIEDGPVDVSVLPATTTIVAKSRSLAWYGQLKLVFVPDRPLYKDTFSSFVLDGLPAPGDTNAGILNPVVIPDTTAAYANGLSKLYQPGNETADADHFVTGRNNDIEVSISPRLVVETSIAPTENYSYPITLAGANSWLMLVQISTRDGGLVDPLTKYNVSVNLTGPDGTELSLELTRDLAGDYWFENKALAIKVVAGDLDGFVANGQFVISSSLDLRDLSNHLGAIVRNGAGGPLGQYTLRLMARRRNTVAPRVLAIANVRVIN